MNVPHSCYGKNILIQWKMKLSIQVSPCLMEGASWGRWLKARLKFIEERLILLIFFYLVIHKSFKISRSITQKICCGPRTASVPCLSSLWMVGTDSLILIPHLWGSHDSKWSWLKKSPILHCQAILKTWPQMTYDLDMWHLTLSAWEMKVSINAASMTQVWFQPNFNFSNEAKFYIFSLSYNVISDDLWP